MTAPTLRAIWLMLAGVPVFLAIAVLRPEYWVLSAAWMAVIVGAMLVDYALAAQHRGLMLDVKAPQLLYINDSDPVEMSLTVNKGAVPHGMAATLETNDLLEAPKTTKLLGWPDRRHIWQTDLTPLRRGIGRLEKLWLTWTGPLGLIRLKRVDDLSRDIPVTPNTRWVKEEAIRLYARDADFGTKVQIDRGDGSEFDALREYTAGMDRRAIDWKHSARHRQLLAKEFRTERNHNIVFAFDTGRLMCEPLGGVPKIDRAINAALLLAYVSLRSGDKTAIFGFDARPGVASQTLTGIRAFPHIQSLAAGLDYSVEDANYTLALTTLASRLQRRSLIILFTDFVDTTSAEIMMENIGRLQDRHLILFACFEDEALGQLINAPPRTPNDVSRAVIADNLLRDRELVLHKLERMGVHVVETRPERFSTDLVSRYLEIKRRELL